MSDTNLRLQVVLSAVDKITRPFRSARDGSKELSAALKVSKDGLKSLNEQAGRIDGFRKTRSQLAVTANNLKAAREEAARLAVQFTETNRPTAQQARLLEQAKNRASQLQQTYNGLRLSVQRQREALNAAGIDTKQLSEAQRRLKTDAQAATGAIERQQAELRKLGDRPLPHPARPGSPARSCPGGEAWSSCSESPPWCRAACRPGSLPAC